MHLEVDRLADAGQMQALKDAILVALADVRAAVADWQPMRERMLEIAEALQGSGMPVDPAARAEARDFLLWCADNHFTFLGYREYEVRDRQLCPVVGSGLGLLRRKDESATPPPGTRQEVLILTKTNARASVHRPGYMDYIGVLEFDAEGRAVRERRFLGLYTSSAYSRRPWDIPVVRQRYEYVMSESGLPLNSH